MPGLINNDSMKPYGPSDNKFYVGSPKGVFQPKKIDGIIENGDVIEPVSVNADSVVKAAESGVGKELTETYSVVVSVGKYVFLAVMLPPYLCIYGIPHWLMMTALPKIFNFIHIETSRIGNFLYEKALTVADLMQGILQQMLGDALSSMNEKSRNFFSGMESMMKALGEQLSALSLSYKQMKADFKSTFIKFSVSLFDNLEWATKAFSEKSAELARQAAQKMNELFNALTNPIANMLNPAAEYLARMARKGKGAIDRGMTELGNRIKEVLDPVILSAQAAAIIVMKNTILITETVMQPVFAFAQLQLNRAGYQLKNAAGQASELFAKAGNSVKKMFKEFVLGNAIRLKEGFSALGRSMWKKMAQLFGRDQGEGRGRKNPIQTILEGFSDGVDAIVLRIASLFSLLIGRLIQWLNRLKGAFIKFLVWMKGSLISFPRRLYDGTAWLLAAFWKIPRRLGLELRQLINSFGAIYRQGMSQVRTMSNDIIALLNQKDSNG